MVIRDLGKYRMTDNYLFQLRHSKKQSMRFTGTERTCMLRILQRDSFGILHTVCSGLIQYTRGSH